MENRMKKVGKVSSFLTKYIGVIIICFSVIAFFWRDGFAWTTSYTSVFLGVAMFGMGLTIKMDDFKMETDGPVMPLQPLRNGIYLKKIIPM